MSVNPESAPKDADEYLCDTDEAQEAKDNRSHGRCAESPNDPKLSDRGVRRGTCMAGGKAAAEAGAVTHGAVRCSAWLGVAVVREMLPKTTGQNGESALRMEGSEG